MADQNDEPNKPNIQADNKSVAVGSIAVGGSTGDINIHAGDIGYSVEEVSVLITQITSTFQSKPFDGRSPYKGLDVFDEEDVDLFFGREQLVDDLVGRVKGSRTVFVTGPSRSGKSSLGRAGLIHALKRGGEVRYCCQYDYREDERGNKTGAVLFFIYDQSHKLRAGQAVKLALILT